MKSSVIHSTFSLSAFSLGQIFQVKPSTESMEKDAYTGKSFISKVKVLKNR